MTNEQLFEANLATVTVVLIPTGLADSARETLAARIAAVVRQQKLLAAKSASVLRPMGDIIVEAGRITIPHEPAAPLRWESPAADAPSPGVAIEAVAWLADCGLSALQAASEVPLLHGGLHPAAWYQDETGRARLGDFGLAEALAAATGESVVCERGSVPIAGQNCGNVYRSVAEDSTARGEWVATWAAHEVKQGDRPSVKADQFALAAALSAIATGRHPYGVELSEPRASYYQIEPHSLLEHREDWRNSSGPARALIDAMGATLARSLASDAQARFTRCADARANLRTVVPDEWTTAGEDIAGALRALDSGGADEFLRRTEKWVDSQRLPAAWRARLAPLVERVRTERDYQIRVRQAEQRVARGREAADLIDLPKAREMARPVVDDDSLPEPLRAAAREVVRVCDEQEQFMKSGADEVAQEYLEAARAAMERREYDAVKAILHGVREDPHTPPLRARQALELAGEAQIAEEREQRHTAMFRQSEADFAARKFSRSIGGLRELIAEPLVAAELADPARKLLVRAEAQARKQAEVLAALEAAKAAWAEGDSARLLTELARVPADEPDAAVIAQRKALYANLDRLRGVRGQIGATRSLLEKEQLAGARRELETARGAGELPKSVMEELASLSRDLEQREAAALARRRAALAEQLAGASGEFERGELDACEDRLERELLSQSDLTPELLAAARALRVRCGRAADAVTTLTNVEQLAREQRYSLALERINDVAPAGLPPPLVERHAALLERVTADWNAYREAQKARLRETLQGVDRALEDGDFDLARSGVQEVLGSDYADADLRKKATRFRAELETQPTIVELLEQIEGLIERDEPAAMAAMQKLPTQLRTWAAARRLAAQEQLRERAEQREEERKSRVASGLARVPDALASGNLRAARDLLGKVAAELQPADDANPAHARLMSELEHAEDWTRRLQAAQTLVDDGQYTQAISRASDELQTSNVPPFAANAFAAICDEARRRIDERRGALMKQLNGLGAQLEARGRRIRHFERRLSELLTDDFATLDHRRKADELRKRFEEMPTTTETAPFPMVRVAGALALLAIAAAAWWFWPFGKTPVTPLIDGNGQANSIAAANENATRPSIVIANANSNAPAVTAVANENAPANENSSAVAVANSNVAANENADAPLIEPATTSPVVFANENLNENADAVAIVSDPANENDAGPPTDSQPIAIAPANENQNENADAVAVSPTTTAPAVENPPTVEVPPVETQPVVATFAEAIAEYRASLAGDLGAALVLNAGQPGDSGEFSIGAQWRGVALLSYDDLSFDASTGTIRPPADAVGDWFARQRSAIDGLESCSWRVAPKYDARLRRSEPVLCAVRSFDERGVLIAVRLALRGDDRSGAGFDCPGYLTDAVFAADEAGRAAFDGYLRGLQAQRLTKASDAAAAALRLPGEQVFLQRESEPGDEQVDPRYRVDVPLNGVRRSLGDATWNPGLLEYEIDGGALANELSRMMDTVLSEGAAPDSLRESWATAVGGLDGMTPGARRIIEGRTVEPLEFAPADSDDPLARAATIRLTADTEGIAEISLAGRVRVGPTGVSWDASQATAARTRLLDQIDAVQKSAAFRTQRTAEALAGLADSLKVAREQLTVVRQGATLEVKLSEPTERKFEAKWSATEFNYEPLKEIVRPTPPITQPPVSTTTPPITPVPTTPSITPPTAGAVAWPALAAAGSLAPAQAADVLRAATSTKIGAAAGWSTSSALQAGEPAARLLGAARGLQKLVASGGNPRDAVRATTFVEFVEAGSDVFGFAFKVENGGDGVATGVAASKVWRVCAASELRQFANAEAFRAKYSTDASWGERLLGPIWSDALRADSSGSVGLVIAPTGPLWGVRWEQVRFNSRPVSGLRGDPAVNQASSLRDLLGTIRDPRNPASERHRKAAVWCVPSLAARFSGAPNGARLSAGTDHGGQALELAFEANAKQCAFATIRSTAMGDFGWPNDKNEYTAQDIGYRFWNRRWTGNSFNQTQALSFALLPTSD